MVTYKESEGLESSMVSSPSLVEHPNVNLLCYLLIFVVLLVDSSCVLEGFLSTVTHLLDEASEQLLRFPVTSLCTLGTLHRDL